MFYWLILFSFTLIYIAYLTREGGPLRPVTASLVIMPDEMVFPAKHSVANRTRHWLQTYVAKHFKL